MRLPRIVAVVIVGTAVLAGAVGAAVAQTAPAGGWPGGLWAPLVAPADVPQALQVSALSITVDDAGTSRAEVRFAGAIDAPTDPWRVSVGIGDPAGLWRRASMLWDGTQATGEVVQLDGLAAVDQGPVEVDVDLSGLVTIGLPEDYLLPASGDVMWVEAALGPTDNPVASVRTPWFDRGALLGEGAPGLVPGGRNGVQLEGSPPQPATTTTGVVDTGVPSVAEWVDGRVVVERGTAPEEVLGSAAGSVVDYVTVVAANQPDAAGAQVRIDLVTGEVDLVAGVLAGPLAPTFAEPGTPVAASTAWLAQPAGLLSVGVSAAFDELGLADPGPDVVVSVTRVVGTDGGGEVATAGVAAGQGWLSQRQAPSTTGAVVTGGAVASREVASGDPVPAFLIGVVVGLVAVGIAVLLAERRARRTHPGPGDVNRVVAGEPDEEFWSR
jgi:hypothetical protein